MRESQMILISLVPSTVADTMKWIVAFIFTFFVGTSRGGKLPPEYQLCKRDDSNLNECLKNAIEDALLRLDNGIPSLNVPSLQPLQVPSVTIGEGKGAVHVVQIYNNYQIYDLKTAKIQKLDAKITSDDLTLTVDIFIPEVRFEADYRFNGRVLLLPIVGDGKCTVKLVKLKATISLYGDTFDKKNTKYLKIKDFVVKLDPQKVVYNFENLFNGDKRLGPEMNRLLNENWKEVYDDIKQQYESALQTIFADYANKIFAQVPFNVLF